MRLIGPFKQSKWDTSKFYRIPPLIRLVSSIMMFNSFFFVAHSNIVSVYDLQSQRWCSHIRVPKAPYKLLRAKDTVYVLLKDTTVFKIEITYNESDLAYSTSGSISEQAVFRLAEEAPIIYNSQWVVHSVVMDQVDLT